MFKKVDSIGRDIDCLNNDSWLYGRGILQAYLEISKTLSSPTVVTRWQVWNLYTLGSLFGTCHGSRWHVVSLLYLFV